MSRPERPESRPWIRLLLVPALLFVAFSAAAFTLSKFHLAKPGVPKIAGSNVVLGDSYQGGIVFEQTCAACHGPGGKGGGIGPKLQGLAIPIAAVKAQIDNGGGTMPPHLVSGQQEKDVLAFLATIIAKP